MDIYLLMDIKKIIRKNLIEHHDLIRHDSSVELLKKATDSLADAVRYLETLSQQVDQKECNETLIRVLDIIRHPMGSVSNDGFNHKDQSNILALLEMISTIISRENYPRQ
jgi:hypothetical protein